jgi:hypothetical protein
LYLLHKEIVTIFSISSSLIQTTEIGLEQAPFVVLVFFSFEHAKNLLIIGPNITKNSSKSVIFSYLTMNNIVRILLFCKNTKFDQKTVFCCVSKPRVGPHEQPT